MNRIFILALLLTGFFAEAQSGKVITIDSCYALARQNCPLLKQHDLIEQTKQYTVENAWRGYIPVLNISGQATYQSQTVSFSDALGALSSIPGFPAINIPTVSKDQYKFTAEVNQTIYDGGVSQLKKQQAQAEAEVKQQNLEVSLYALRDRVNQVFFGTLVIEEEIKLNDLQQKDVQNGIDKVQALVANGTAYKSSVDELKAQLLQVQQAKVQLLSGRKAYLTVLGLLTNETLDDNTVLQKPEAPALGDDIKRPEADLFEVQKKTYNVQLNQLKYAFRPHVNGFFDGSYGRPTFNIISNDFGFFWIAGLHFNWSLSPLYTFKNDKRIISLNQSNLDIQKEAFLFNTHVAMGQQNEEMKKYTDLLANDRQIVELRSSVKEASNAQLQNGVITAHDYLTQVDAEAQARQNMALHQLQLLQAEYNYKNTTGN